MKRIFSTLAIFSLASTSIYAQDGALDLNFFNQIGAHGEVTKILVANDNKIYLVGSFPNINNNPQQLNRVARLNADGTVDNTFNVGDATAGGASSIAIQNDGKLLIGAPYYISNSILGGLKRFNSDGTPDYTFSTGDVINSSVGSMAIQPDSKIIIGGGFTTVGGTGKNRIARLLPDGNIDNTFNVGTGADSGVSFVKLLPNGKVIAGGSFTTFAGVAKNKLVKLNTDGSIDTSFVYGAGPNAGSIIYSGYIQSDGKILLTGNFSTFSGVNRRGAVRLNADGSVDSTFSIGTGATGKLGSLAYIYDVTVQNDGKILLTGDFDTFNGSPRKTIVRLNPNGSVDTTFSSPGAFYQYNNSSDNDGIIRAVALQGSKILVGGFFVKYGNVNRGYFARLSNTSFLGTKEERNLSVTASVSPNPAKEYVKIKSDQIIEKIQIFTNEGRIVLEKSIKAKEADLDIKHWVTGDYVLNLIYPNGSKESKKLIKE